MKTKSYHNIENALFFQKGVHFKTMSNSEQLIFNVGAIQEVKNVSIYLEADVYKYSFTIGGSTTGVKVNAPTIYKVFFREYTEANYIWHSSMVFSGNSYSGVIADPGPQVVTAFNVEFPKKGIYYVLIEKQEQIPDSNYLIEKVGKELKEQMYWAAGYWSKSGKLILTTPVTLSNFTLLETVRGGCYGIKADYTLKDLSIHSRIGTKDQNRIPGFGNISRYYTYSGEKIVHGPVGEKAKRTSTVVDGVRLRVSSPALFVSDSEGNKSETQVGFNIFYKKSTESTWKTATYSSDNSNNDTVFVIKGSESSVHDVFFTVMFPEKAIYDVKVRRITEDSVQVKLVNDTYLSAMVEIESSDIGYINTALLGFSIKSTEKLSGGTPTASVVVSGRTLKDVREMQLYETANVPERWADFNTGAMPEIYQSKNPANILYDLVTNKRYGLGNCLKHKNIHLDSFCEFADYCDDLVPYKKHKFEIPGYDNTVHYERGMLVLNQDTTRAFRCKKTYSDSVVPSTITTSNTQYWVELEIRGEWVIDFRRRFEMNLVVDSLFVASDFIKKITETCRATPYWRGTQLAIFVDKPSDPVQLFSAGNIIPGTFKQTYVGGYEVANQISVEFLNAEKNWDKEAIVVVDVTEEARRDKIEVSIQMYGITDPSVIFSEATRAMRLGKMRLKSIEFETFLSGVVCQIGDVFYFQHHVPKYGLEGGHVAKKVGDMITLSHPLPTVTGKNYVLRIQKSNVDSVEIGEIFHTITFPGDNTEKVIFNAPGVEVGDVFIFGELYKDSKLYRVTKMTRKDTKVQIGAIEYHEEVYDDSIDALMSDQYFMPKSVHNLSGRYKADYIPNIRNIGLSERTITKNGITSVELFINYPKVNLLDRSQEYVFKYEIWVKKNGGSWQKAGETTDTYYAIPCSVGDTFYVAVFPVTNFGNKAHNDTSYYERSDFYIEVTGAVDSVFEGSSTFKPYLSGVFSYEIVSGDVFSNWHSGPDQIELLEDEE